MRKRLTLPNQFSLAALVVCGLVLSGCGDGGNNSPNNISDPDVNQLPSCTILGVSVDLTTQEIVKEVFHARRTRRT